MLLAISRCLSVEVLTRTPIRVSIRNIHKEPIPVAWKKPRKGWTKLNFDGSSRGKTGKASIGGVFRDHNAEFLLGYAESIGKSSSTVAELAALRRGLQLAIENGWSNVWLEGDAKTLVDMIGKRRRLVVRSAEGRRHVNDINEIIPELENCMVTHVYREGNRVADKFAQIGHRLTAPEVWREVPPPEVLAFVHEDANGKVVLRRRR
ncbi:hypothetical protein Nepgr_032157 [Nepenthes gracilis]|uniref:RNase H type-1 domain-containing protein n=1 Tax=Nepenthes gracilis TaxID=150966 RepID=A0AAD3Y7N5_NEPGR|nr:hypothetical protein Nepgr_032157 [Nepenthes gracilis]